MSRYIIFCIQVCFLLLVGGGVCSAEVYKWVDEKGRVHFGDSPAETQQVEQVNLEVNTYESVSYEDVEFAAPVERRATGKVTMYATSWCGYCKQARNYFVKNNIPYTEYDIEKNKRAKQAYDKLGATGVPVILVGKKRMNGFSVKGFQRIYQ